MTSKPDSRKDEPCRQELVLVLFVKLVPESGLPYFVPILNLVNG